jgi:hypothetical protein
MSHGLLGIAGESHAAARRPARRRRLLAEQLAVLIRLLDQHADLILGMDVIARRPLRGDVDPQQGEIFVAKDRDVIGRLVDRHGRSLVLRRRRQRERASEKRCCKQMPHGMILPSGLVAFRGDRI